MPLLGGVDGFDEAAGEGDDCGEAALGLLPVQADALEALELSEELLDAGKAGRSFAFDLNGMAGAMPRARAASRLALAS